MINYNLTHMKLNTFITIINIMYTLLYISASYVYENYLHKRKSESTRLTRFSEEYISERLFQKLVKLGEGIHPFKNIYINLLTDTLTSHSFVLVYITTLTPRINFPLLAVICALLT